MNGRFEIYIRPRRGFGAAPTHDGLTLIIGGWPYAEFAPNKVDVERTFQGMLDLVPEFSARVARATREERFAGYPLPNYFHKPYGPGWALVGDAGYLKDSITAQGITDAFHDAERCAAALHLSLSGAEPFDEVMSAYQRERDERVRPMFEMTCELARLAPPSPEMRQLLSAIADSQEAMDGFVRMNAGTISPREFFSPENIGAITRSAGLQSR
jgi:2-polyprenyl-6-methoxyphenol hydroxylase-like FAD-dependent oxidoreductase